ncbi:helix-turn-helix domain-containing protein [Noviherbaspirillum aerium]|uniref:helix-turn-helix domain-containing protein n=1 Tax=Noviherbaspirillum aerium TaxID=2588497 RepID=UPI00124D24FC|nr:helix-turn-helix transcriptional regulator [Noviherbaspirillum aerium]
MTTPIEKEEAELRARFAHNVRIIRVQKGISQEDLADASRLHRTFVSDVEREVRNLSLASIARLADALKVDAIEFFRPIDPATEVLPRSLPKGPRKKPKES